MEMLSAAKSSIAVTQAAVHADHEDIQLLGGFHIFLSILIKNMIYS
jgi:hypothetical protein